jgi:hypothetical protein
MQQLVAAAQSSVNGVLVVVAVFAAAIWWVVRNRARKTAPRDIGEVSTQWIAQHRSARDDGAH